LPSLAPNRHSPPDFKDETGNAVPSGEMLAAEIRHRAAGDASFLLPAAHSVKGNPSPLAVPSR